MSTNPPTNPGSTPQGEQTRLITLVGTVVGGALLFTALVLAVYKWDVFLGGMEQWKKSWGWVGGTVLAALAGMGALFFTLHMLRTQERENPTLRRLIYGYNALVTGVLMLGVLVIINFLVYVPVKPFTWVNKTYDWTQSTLYSLDPKMQSFLENLDQPVEIDILLPGFQDQSREYAFVAQELDSLTRLMVAAAPTKVTVHQYSPDSSPQDIQRLKTEYGLTERIGVFLIYGTKPDAKTALIPYERLSDVKGSREEGERMVFLGEGELLSQLRTLAQSAGEGNAKQVIYFTQGDGEPELGGSMGHFGAAAESLSQLQASMTNAGFTV